VQRLALEIPAGHQLLPTPKEESEPPVVVLRSSPAEDGAELWEARLVIKVADSSVVQDRARATGYCEAGVAEYWIVRRGDRRIEVHRRPTHAGYREKEIFGPGTTASSDSLPGFRLRVNELFS
jgi:Uma2 family endonuclease